MTESRQATGRSSLEHRGNRVMWAVIAAVLAWFAFQAPVVALLVGVVLYAVLTAIVSGRARSGGH